MERQYRDSGIKWIGRIPKEWKACRFKYTGSFEKGKLPVEQNIEQKGLPIIGASEMLGKEPRVFTLDNVVPVCKKEDILILWDGANAGIVANGCEGVVSSTAVKFDCNDSQYNKQFMFYLLKYYENYFRSKVGGTTIPHMNQQYINDCICLLPSLSEQQQIAEYLDGKCGEIAGLIALQEQMIAQLADYKRSVITEAVTKGLNPDAQLVPSGIDWIGNVPKGWPVAKAKYFVEINNGSDPKEEGNIPVYGSGASSFKTCGEYKEGPTVLIGRKGATLHIPHYIEGKYWNVDTAFDVKIKKEMILRYYYYLAICFDYKYYISQTTLPGMAQSSYYNMQIPVPPLAEQRTIADYLDMKCGEIDKLIETKRQKIETLKEYKKSVIYEAVTGKTIIQ